MGWRTTRFPNFPLLASTLRTNQNSILTISCAALARRYSFDGAANFSQYRLSRFFQAHHFLKLGRSPLGDSHVDSRVDSYVNSRAEVFSRVILSDEDPKKPCSALLFHCQTMALGR